MIRKRYLINVQIRIAPIPADRTTPRDQRVGGQLIIVLGKWANRVINFIKDPTLQGVVTGLYLRTGIKQHLMIISSYWPIPTQDPTTGQLWNKVLHHIRRWNYTCSPLEFCQRFINEHLIRHLKKHMANTAILVGDLNATWNPSAKGGCHSGFQSGLIARDGPIRYTASPYTILTPFLPTG